MVGTSDKAVSEYLDTLFLDIPLPPVQEFVFQLSDSVDTGYRLVPCTDLFAVMNESKSSLNEIWEVFLQLLLLGQQLPPGPVQAYVFKQSQILYQKTQLRQVG
ncbi:MAG: hypothetical protein HWE18_16250 [Gammaproteobacteria bacterium]|nr:hypothetical protein [Gammaproteobacteria bacterium]